MQSLQFLFHLMHRNASVECRKKGLEVLNTILTNIIENPLESKYRRINITSLRWTSCVAPAFNLFNLIRWLVELGFEQDTENSLLFFKGDNLDCIKGVSKQLCFLMRVHTPTSALTQENNDEKNQEANKFLPLLRFLTGLTDGSDLESVAIPQDFADSRVYPTDEEWENVKDTLRLTVLYNEYEKEEEMSHDPVIMSRPQFPLNRSMVWESLLQVVRRLPLSRVEEDVAVIDAERVSIQEINTKNLSRDKNYSKETPRKRVAERHRRASSHRDDSSAKIHAEVRLVGTRLIADIASCIEQIAAIKGMEGIVRKDRLEGQKLLKKFNKDGDIEYLHLLKDEWTERLESAKEKHGRPFVYL
ncbi:PUB domain [Trypanosoma melophagium]|uniref:PUB domain n=1 Tax=Trypanosoma melophagium TaxID=715481 RepID=UPI00351A4650|nr:PUB domain [Trypanosoma melophagium]